MANKISKKFSAEFGKKEKVLNYACQTYQLSRPNKVGAVMSLIRECQPKTINEWEKWYFEKAFTEGKSPIKITPEILNELGERLYEKITEVVIPEWQAAFNELSLEDCKDYVYNLTVRRTYDGFIREKSVVNDGLSKIFLEVKFIESENDLDHAGDIDYLGFVDKFAFGIQIKPITARANFGNYSVSERMKNNFIDFENKYKGKVFIIFSLDGEIGNKEVLKEIQKEIGRLKNFKT
ncbi:MAG: restriction endonuclease [Candidatus Staskawiczbacteria bacterium RIFOXYD2_FULL_37_9]|uniref:Restriction endonuclease n=1 Tax=Candidatus Staskawiczbacteria bacterium RIFOXYB1_FULL_37_44 TaxID=1802223 RepID=A0A1G2IWK6_9BACT|nr:MAG: restriction endonuclease [Candidatus Staskawiczbacteria bacterium RIFOXYB1_FULL_37_44]OGZ83848.1 MAG: restriction endonuclease [Candidatus Staskawiczbacteria bacterium RIFOXYC1_FULL_37_52]OGZ87791.1 MAG: restriction endonuclease [Candidatus Staskawiczbacteria bacterium RIFOXYC2_FULL_37_19]OGZ89355.1 MAG: restriction endonuclease [Candidatus Staskawiczbacteria bacterium RIFOXYD1_FULL_37_110]OGZ94517.1 MAG: restriction endonuclease [Candidatus Staskawiczbacteria bacterium RIFOXYD2_FULL_37